MKRAGKKRKPKTRRAKPGVSRARHGRKPVKERKSSEPRHHYFIHDGLKLHYWEWGDPKEETYIFVHGVRDQGRSWDHFH